MELIQTSQDISPKVRMHHPIHPYRFNGLLALVQGDHWHAHVLDRLIYRCQQSTLTYRGQQAFTEPLEDFAAFVEATSVRNLQYAMTQLEKLGLLGRQGTYTDYGSQCILWLTPKMWAHLTDQQAKEGAIAQPADNPVTSPDKGMYQAENLYRYTAMTSLLGKNQKGRAAFLQHYVLNHVMYRAQVEANRQQHTVNTTLVNLSLKQAADTLSLSPRTLQRHLRALEAKGLLIKSRKKINRCQVATFYQVAPSVWSAMAQTAHITLRQPAKSVSLARKLSANHGPVTAIKAIQKSDQKVVNLGGNRRKPRLPQEDEKFVHPKDEEIVHRNKNINKININKNHITACEQPNVLRETCQDNEHKSDVVLKNKAIISPTTLPLGKRLGKEESLPLETNLLQTPTLNARQRRYVQGMLTRLTAEHGCQFSNPAGLLHEICFALRQVKTIFPGRHSFRHRLNLIGKLLREKRWTTPHGYERYDPQGMAQKTKRQEKEAAWQAKKAAEGQGGLVRLRSVTAANAPSGPPSAIATRLAEMRHLARRAEAADCSTAARESIMALLQRHQAAIVAEMATQKESQG